MYVWSGILSSDCFDGKIRVDFAGDVSLWGGILGSAFQSWTDRHCQHLLLRGQSRSHGDLLVVYAGAGSPPDQNLM